MADFTIPVTWAHEGNDGQDKSVFSVIADHTTTENYLIVFTRKRIQAVNGQWTKPSWRCRIIRSFVDADGLPLSQKAVVDTQCSWPSAAPAADVKAMITLNGAIFSDVELPADVVDQQRIPLSA